MGGFILMILLIAPGVWSRDWGVTFENQCAVKGTSVVLKCAYDYPSGHTVTSMNWYKGQFVSGQYTAVHLSRLSSPPEFKYVGNNHGDCSLKIYNVRHSDEGFYYFGFKTTRNQWLNQSPAHLSVKELTAVVQPSTVTEGDSVELTCMSGCRTTVVWFKDGQPAPRPSFSARRGDAGRYYCAVPGQEAARSAPVALNVLYAPRGVTLAVSPPPDGITTESSVNLTCSSDANPPVSHSGYSLYKDGQLVSVGQVHTIPAVQPSHGGLYLCQASNNISRNGLHSVNSTQVHVDVQYRPMNVVASVDPPRAAEGSPVNLTCSCAANPAADNYTWYKRPNAPGSSSPVWVGSGQVVSLLSMEPSHTGLYVCRAANRLGGRHSAEVLLTMELEGAQSLPVLAGVGVFLFGTLLVAVILLWRKWKSRAKKKTVTDLGLSGRGSSSSANEDETPYANFFPSSPPPETAAPNTNPAHDHHVYSWYEDEVSYSTVNIKARNHSGAPHASCSREEDDACVIYAAVVKPGDV